jgi:hypothetical protein
VALLTGIKRLLHDEGLTIRGVQKILRDHGVRHVAGLSGDQMAVEESLANASALMGDDLADIDDLADDARVVPILPVAAAAPMTDTTAPLPEVTQKPAASVASQPVQPPLPLFDAAPALRPLRDDVTLASMIRALPSDQPFPGREAMAAVARRLATLRATMARRADGGPG